MLNLVARKAEHIVTISEYSKAQIVERLGVQAEKVTAIHCGVNGQFRCADRKEACAAVSEALGIEEPYLLFVGSLKPHKNIFTLLQAFMLLRQGHDIRQRLLIVGDDDVTDFEIGVHTAGDARKRDLPDREAVDGQLGFHGGIHHADAALKQEHRLVFDSAGEEDRSMDDVFPTASQHRL